MCSFGVFWIRISHPRSVWNMVHKGTSEYSLVMDSSVPLMYSVPWSRQILDHEHRSWVQNTPKKHALKLIHNILTGLRRTILQVLLIDRLPQCSHTVKTTRIISGKWFHGDVFLPSTDRHRIPTSLTFICNIWSVHIPHSLIPFNFS